jgi:hypothetical protein
VQSNVGNEKVIVKFEYLVLIEHHAAVSSRLFRGKFSDHVLAPTGSLLQLLTSNIQGDVRDFLVK